MPDRCAGAKSAPLLTTAFLLVCVATGLFYLSFYLLLPGLPLYVKGLGGTPAQLGLMFGYYASMAMLLRLPGGWLIDRQGSRPILLAGMAIFLLASLAYVAVKSVPAILALRLFHGTGMGLFPTAATVVVAELAPPERRGEAMGWFGFANSLAMIVGPTLGAAVAQHLGFSPLFFVAAGSAALGLACLLPLPASRPLHARDPRFRLGDLVSSAAIFPSALLLFLCAPYGTLMAFGPILAVQRGLGNPGLFYTVFAAAMLLVRAKAGEISDRRGRIAAVLPGMLLAAGGLGCLAMAETPTLLLVGAAVYGLGLGGAQPALMALAADRVSLADRGKAMGTFYTAWELGIAGGSTAAGWLLTSLSFPPVLLGCALLPAIGTLLSLRGRRKAAPR